MKAFRALILLHPLQDRVVVQQHRVTVEGVLSYIHSMSDMNVADISDAHVRVLPPTGPTQILFEMSRCQILL